MTGVGTEDKTVGVIEKVRCARWERRVISNQGCSVKTYTIFKHKCTLVFLFFFGGVKNLTLANGWVKFF